MAVPPRKIRQLPLAQAPSDGDVFPVSQMNSETGIATTRAMTRMQLQSDLIQVINEARQMFVTQSEETHAYLQEQIDTLHTSVEQNETTDEQMQAALVMIQQMINGESGKTPYDLWLDAGNTGTLQDYLNSMIGPRGPAGPQGIPGPMGQTGAAGPKGDQGQMGPTGSTGEKGDAGIQGIPGPRGDTGPQGATGQAGPRGEVGTTGAKGDIGATGPKGDKGDKGDTGDVGPTGAAGPAGLGTITVSTPTRAIGTAFRPSTTKATLCTYSVQVQAATPLLAGSATATVELLSDANATPTTVRARASVGQQVGLSVSIAITDSNVIPLSYIVPAGHYVLLKSTTAGTASTSIVAQVEEALG